MDIKIGQQSAGLYTAPATITKEGNAYKTSSLLPQSSSPSPTPAPTGGNLIVVARDISLSYDSDSKMFMGTVPSSAFPADYVTSPHKYNLMMVFGGVQEGNLVLGYTANHFCYLFAEEGASLLTAICYDSIPEMQVIHTASLNRDNPENDFSIGYTGTYEDSILLPETGSTVSVYLQPLY